MLELDSLMQRRPEIHEFIDAQVGNALIEVKFCADALRTVRTALIQVAYAMAEKPGSEGYLVLVDSGITAERLREEWEKASAILDPHISHQLMLCLMTGDQYIGIPNALSPAMKPVLDEVVAQERAKGGGALPRPDYSLIILKILLNRWTTTGEPMTADSLAQIAGCTYPTVARVVTELGSLVQRTSDRRISLRYFPKDVYLRLVANSDKFRKATRFTDNTGQIRSPETHLRRLEMLGVPGLAIGGAIGARHYCPDLDLIGTPRLDLSLHAYRSRASLEFMKKLDPALKREDDPLRPASVVVHFIQQKDPLFSQRAEGLCWADPLDCLLDLHESRLEGQAAQFLSAIERNLLRTK